MEALSILPFIVLTIIWVALAIGLSIKSSDLCRSFCAAYPDEADLRIPYAFSTMRHPRKITYFIAAESRIFLEEKKDAALLQKRRSMLRWLTTFLSLHFGAMLVGAIALLLLKL